VPGVFVLDCIALLDEMDIDRAESAQDIAAYVVELHNTAILSNKSVQSDECLLGGKHDWITQTNGEYTKTVCSKCRTRR